VPARAFLESLQGRPREQALALIELLERRGNLLREPHSKQVEAGLFELRSHRVRIFYTFRPGRRIVLLDGMIKKRDEIPAAVLDRVRLMVREIRELDARAKEKED